MSSMRPVAQKRPVVTIDPLEPRRLLAAWGHYPQLIDQDLAAASYPALDGRGYAIADLDTGVALGHPALAGKVWTNPGEVPNNGRDDDGNGYADDVHGWNFVNNNNNVADDQGHGTMTAGLLVAKRSLNWGNARGYAGDKRDYQGVASGATVIPLKVIDSSLHMDPKRVEKALQWVLANHKRYRIAAVNMSLSVGLDGHNLIADELKALGQAGVFVAASAGNGYNADDNLVFPAAGKYAFAVGALDANDALHPVTSRGPSLDLLAPGNEVPYLGRSSDFDLSGPATSPATPWVAGAAAILKQLNPQLTSDQVAAILKDSGKPVYDKTTGLTFKRLDLDDAIALAAKRSGIPLNTGPAPAPVPTPAPAPAPAPAVPAKAIQAEKLSSQRGITIGWNGLGHIDDGDWARYAKHNFGSTTGGLNAPASPATFSANVAVAPGFEGGVLQVRLDSPTGKVVASMTLRSTGGWDKFQVQSAKLTAKVSGTHDLVLTFSGKHGIANVDWFLLA